MKKFITAVSILVCIALACHYAYYYKGVYIKWNTKEVTSFTSSDAAHIYVNHKPFEIKGVNLGSGIPGEWSTDFAIPKETYLRWFEEMQEMGANTLRIYTVQSDDFYEAFYEYNKNNPDPLWLIHGVWVNDYIQNSHRDAYAKEFVGDFTDNSKTMIDVIHGNRKISLGRMASAGSGDFRYDISPWVIGYILGVEWEDVTVAYTNDKYRDDPTKNTYQGKYMYTTDEATPFEAMLASVGDSVIAYESERYGEQRLVAFSNWPTTDPFDYPEKVEQFFIKCAKVDVEHIRTTKSFISGCFASYHVYPYYPDYLNFFDDYSRFGVTDVSQFRAEDGALNTYRLYLSLLTRHHRSMPVVISEFGVSTGRGIAQTDQNTNRNQGHMSEKEQGDAVLSCYRDIKAAGCCGAVVFSWQDEWFKRTWNTMYAVDLKRTPYWSDYQTNEQYFGLLSFDPGKEKCVCYVDGDTSEWSEEDRINEHISVKYDERFIYFLIHKDGLDMDKDKIYIPIDTTQKSGSTYCKNFDLRFERPADFVIEINGRDKTRLLVQERYEAIRANYAENVYRFNTYVKENIPAPDSPEFIDINLMLKLQKFESFGTRELETEVFPTGLLRYGNANPDSRNFDSLADFISSGDEIELKLPWQLLNFADASRMTIHDDYYEHYGVEFTEIDEMHIAYADAKTQTGRLPFSSVALKGWENRPTYHERLKSSYYILQKEWGDKDEN